MTIMQSYLAKLPEQQQQESGGFYDAVGENPIPAIWEAYAPEAERLIDRGAAAKLRAGAESLASGRRQYEEELGGAFQAAGLNPLLGQLMLGETYNDLGEKVAGLEAGIEGERNDDLFNLLTGVTGQIAGAAGQERNLQANRYLASKARRTARKSGGGLGEGLGSLAGAGLGLYLGGPQGAALGASAGGQLGGSF